MRPRRFKVLFPFVGHQLGGSKLSSMELMTELRSRDHSPVAIVHRSGPVADELQRRGLAVEVAPELQVTDAVTPRYYWHFLRSVLHPCIDRIRACGVDLVHTNDNPTHITWGVAAWAARVPHVWHQRELKVPRGPYGRFIRPTVVVAPSLFVRSRLPARMRVGARVVPNPVNAEFRRGQDSSEPQAHTPYRVCWIANLRERKRPFHALEALATLVHSDDGPWQLVIVGDDREISSHQLDQRAREMGISERLQIFGAASPTEAIRQMEGSEIALVTGRDESFGRILVEALSVGTRVVAYDSGAHSEVLERLPAGWTVIRDGDITALAAAARAAREQGPLSGAEQRAIKDNVVAQYSAAQHTDSLLDLYEGAMA